MTEKMKIYRFAKPWRYVYEVKAKNLEDAQEAVKKAYSEIAGFGTYKNIIHGDWEFLGESEVIEVKITKTEKLKKSKKVDNEIGETGKTE